MNRPQGNEPDHSSGSAATADAVTSLRAAPRPVTALRQTLGAAGWLAILATTVILTRRQLNVVTYTIETFDGPWLSMAAAFASFLISAALLVPAAKVGLRIALASFGPGLLALPSLAMLLGQTQESPSHSSRLQAAILVPLLIAIIACAWRAGLAIGRHRPQEPGLSPSPVRFTTTVIILTAALVAIHIHLQQAFFDHFMLGHADIGHFTQELRNVLAGRGLRCDDFPFTRLGWHFVPLMYVLVPGYAVWPSPTYLMACGAIFTHAPAIIAYFGVLKMTRSPWMGFAAAATWLLLPTTSRMVYSNTYGFQWITVVMPLIVGLITLALPTLCSNESPDHPELPGTGRRDHTRWILIGLILLVRETTTAFVAGWGLFLLLFTRRRVRGIVIMTIAAAYLWLCLYVLIPHFAGGMPYERFSLYGELGRTPGAFLSGLGSRLDIVFRRLTRPELWYFLGILITALGGIPLLWPRLLVPALPSLGMIALLANAQWLNVKFWHAAAVVPVLFMAGVVAICRARAKASPRATAMAASMLAAAAWCHFLAGFSPVAQPYAALAADGILSRPDPRLNAVAQLRKQIPKSRTILASERLAAHFTDYHRLYTSRPESPADYVIIDRSDHWGNSTLPREWHSFAEQGYRLKGEFGAIIVWERAADSSP